MPASKPKKYVLVNKDTGKKVKLKEKVYATGRINPHRLA